MPKKKPARSVMTRKRGSLQTIGLFTLVDELMASADKPWDKATWEHRVKAARDALTRLQSPRHPLNLGGDWAVLTMVCNLVMILVGLKHLQDPDGLLADAKAALQAPLSRYTDADGMIALQPAEARVVGFLLDDWQEAMEALPARDMVRACRETERRVAAMDAGRPLSPTDRVVSLPS